MADKLHEERLREQFPFMYERKLRASQQIKKPMIPKEFFRKQETSIKVAEGADNSNSEPNSAGGRNSGSPFSKI